MPLRVSLGATGSGKTYHLQKLVADALRDPEWGEWSFLVLDYTRSGRPSGQWPGEPAHANRGQAPLSVVRVRSVERAAAKLAEGCRYVILLVDESHYSADMKRGQWSEVADAAAGVCIESPRPVILVTPEAHTIAPEHYPLQPNLVTLVHEHRHSRAGWWLDDQHGSYVKNQLLNACKWRYLFATANETDLRRYASWHRDLPADVERVTALACDESGQVATPGYHVVVPMNPAMRRIIGPDGREVAP